MSRLFLVRHGPTHEKAFAGWRDVPADLSDEAAISRLRAFLPKNAVMVSSDLIRSKETANAIAADYERLPDEKGLREFHFGKVNFSDTFTAPENATSSRVVEDRRF